MATTGQGARATERDIDQIIAGPSLAAASKRTVQKCSQFRRRQNRLGTIYEARTYNIPIGYWFMRFVDFAFLVSRQDVKLLAISAQQSRFLFPLLLILRKRRDLCPIFASTTGKVNSKNILTIFIGNWPQLPTDIEPSTVTTANCVAGSIRHVNGELIDRDVVFPFGADDNEHMLHLFYRELPSSMGTHSRCNNRLFLLRSGTWVCAEAEINLSQSISPGSTT